jgi:hypothetical protein
VRLGQNESARVTLSSRFAELRAGDLRIVETRDAARLGAAAER